jgi:hypothetical protein
MNKKEREELRMMFGGKCAYCGCELGKVFHADHIEAVMRQSKIVKVDQWRSKFVSTGKMDYPEKDTIDNLFPACPRCNIAKGTFTIEEFRRWIEGSLGRVIRYENPMKLARDFGLFIVVDKPVVFHFELAKESE